MINLYCGICSKIIHPHNVIKEFEFKCESIGCVYYVYLDEDNLKLNYLNCITIFNNKKYSISIDYIDNLTMIEFKTPSQYLGYPEIWAELINIKYAYPFDIKNPSNSLNNILSKFLKLKSIA